MKYFAAIFLFFSALCSYGQLAGVVGASYVDINPDTAIDCHTGGIGFGHEDFLLDINGDSQADFSIQGWSGGSQASAVGSVILQPLNSYSYILQDRIDSIHNNWPSTWYVYHVAKSLGYGDSIAYAGSVWDSSSCTIYNNSYVTGSHIYIHDFPDSVDRYIGIKCADADSTYYGWIRITMSKTYPYKTCTVKDYSLYPGVTGIPTLPSGAEGVSFLPFPNPAGNYFCIKNPPVPLTEVEVSNMAGKKIMLQAITTDPATVKFGTETLEEGLYIVSFQIGSGLTRKKLVVKK
jgi:hypothetical protein